MSKNTILSHNLRKASGKIEYTFTNDYMFRIILQEHPDVTKALVAALLHLDISDIVDLIIQNPIELDDEPDGKYFVLDLLLLLNDSSLINLEMQVVNQHNWPDRSLSYACRTFNNIEKGEDYTKVLPVICIDFLDFTLFPEAPEFYSRHLMMNVKTHKIYSDKLDLRVVELNQIKLATEEDITYHIDYWAKLFKATTWEEIKMLASKDINMNEAADALFEYNSNEAIRRRCFSRAEAMRNERSRELALQEALKKLEQATAEKDAVIAKLDTAVAKNTSLVSENQMLYKLLAEHGIEIPKNDK